MIREEKSTVAIVHILVQAFLNAVIEPERGKPDFVLKQMAMLKSTTRLVDIICKSRNTEFKLQSPTGDIETIILMGKKSTETKIIKLDGKLTF